MANEQLSQLERQIQTLEQVVLKLDNRVAALEGHEVVEAETTVYEDQGSEPGFGIGISASRFMFLLGRAILILAGGFLLRALAGGGGLPASAGFGLGMVYSLGLTLLVYRIFHGGDRIGAASLGVTITLVAFPFLTESITKMQLVSAEIGGISLVVITASGLWTAWRWESRFLAWAFCLAALPVLVVLVFSSGIHEFYALLLLLLGVATVLLAYTRKWHFKRWLVACAVNAVFLRLTIMATGEGLASGTNSVSAPWMLALDLLLLVVYLGFFCSRALVWGKGVKVFDVMQSLFALAVGFGGAVHIAQATGTGESALGWTALVAALGFYTIAFTVVRSRLGRGRGFFYFASLGLVFLLLGGRTVAHGSWLSWSWLALGLLMAILGSRFDRVTLRTHSAIYLTLASIQTGMMGLILDAFTASANSTWHSLNPTGTLNLAVVLACYGIFILRRGHDQDSKLRRVPGLVAAVLGLMGLGSLGIVFTTQMLASTPPEADAPTLAVIRTAVLSLTAVVLAIACRRTRFRELGWLVYPLLAMGGMKILMEDLRQGTPLTLFVGFGFWGLALILAPRLLSSGRRKATAEEIQD